MSTRRSLPRSVAAASAVLLAATVGPAAHADDDGPVIPSRAQVESAQAQVDQAERSVRDIQADLAAASTRLEELGMAAEQAAEAYNGALLRLQEAKEDAQVARKRAVRAERKAAVAKRQLLGLMVDDASSGSALTQLGQTVSADGPSSLLAQMSTYDVSEQTMDAQYQTWEAASDLAAVYQKEAAAALKEADDAEDDAAEARSAAQTAVEAQQAAVTEIDTQRGQLLQELADAQDISLELATARQEGLEQRRQERLAEQRRLERLREQRAQEREQRRLDRIAELQQQRRQERIDERREQRRQERLSALQENRRQDRVDQRREDRLDQRRADRRQERIDQRREQRRQERIEQRRQERREQRREERRQSAPPPASPPSQSGSAQDAIDFAYAQLGEPYVWGAAGPSSWDCSGLTMGAWAAAGVYLPHYSVAQYEATTPISYSDLRPGDLVFWASNPGDPGTIFHVGLYIGNDQMIHAPRTGQDVKVENIWYWEDPDFFGRP